MVSPNKALINGVAETTVSIADRGFQYGDGVFSTIPVVRSSPIFPDLHLRRLEHDSGRLGIPYPSKAPWIDEIKQLTQENGDGVIKIMLTRGIGGRGYRYGESCRPTRVVSWHPTPDYAAELLAQGVRVRFCTGRLGINLALAGLKHMNRLEQIVARAEWDDQAIHEGLMLDQEGFVVEGVMSNLFAVKDGRLLTPLLDRCGVAGVMRGRIILLARSAGIPVVECRMEREQVLAADELFLSNCIIRLWPIRALEHANFKIGPIARALANLIDQEEAQCLV